MNAMGGCCCNRNRKPWTKTVTLSFMRSELIHDIGNYAYVEGDVTVSQDNGHDRHQVFDIVQEGNVERITRVLDLTFAQVSELCYPYTKADVDEDTSATDIYDEAYAYTLDMKVPDDFSNTTVRLLKEQVHELLVTTALADWLGVTKPEAQATWLARAEKARDGIKGVLFARGGRRRRTLSPF